MLDKFCRKLGEGAFGMVYGGESRVESGSGGDWVAVAVKTLKEGSSVEEKIDFLSEAELMKSFDHRNIVRLLGVCTRFVLALELSCMRVCVCEGMSQYTR